jgi:hypothetical protein
MVVQLRRDFRAIELRDVASQGLSGRAEAPVDLRDVIIELRSGAIASTIMTSALPRWPFKQSPGTPR